VGRETWGPVRSLDVPTRPLLGWSVDLMGPMPPDERGNRYLAVAIDVFSKWVEARALPDKCAFTTCEWLYDDVIARWGRPLYIRLDRGGEWEAEFGAALRRLHILPRRGTSGNSRYNGLSERYIRVFREVIRKYLGQHPTAYWTDIVPYALMALRHTPVRAHGFPPFTVLTGMVPVLASDVQLPAVPELPEDATEQQEEEYTLAIIERIESLMDVTRERLDRRGRMVQAALRRREAAG
jgi:Integrase core domain